MKKQIISIALVISLLLSLVITVSSAYYGDVNGDSKVTATDARDILRHSTKVALLPDSMIKIADVNSDGKITAVDARITLRISAKLENLIEYSDNQQQQQPPVIDESEILPVTYNYSFYSTSSRYSSNQYYKFYTSGNYNVLETKYYYGDGTGGKIVTLYFDKNGKIQKNNMDSFDSTGKIYLSESMFIKYDDQSNISFVSLNGYRYDYKHNSSGKITEIKEIKPYVNEPTIQKFVYDSQNRLTKFYYGSNCSTELKYNDKGLITSIKEVVTGSANDSATSEIKYDKNGQIASSVTNFVYGFSGGRSIERDFAYDDSNNNLIFQSSLMSDGGYGHTEYEHSNKNGTKTFKIKGSSSKYTLYNDTQISSSESYYDGTYTHSYEYKKLSKEQIHMYDTYNKYLTFFYVESRPFYIDSFSPTSQVSIMLNMLPRLFIDVGYYPYTIYKEIIDIYK